MTPEHSPMPPGDDSIDLLDVLLTIAENLKWLILWPVLGGALVYGLTHLLPEKYESTSIIKGEGSVAASMTAAHVLDGALRNLGYLDQLNEEQAEEAREDLQRNVSTSVLRGTKLVSLTVAGRTPEAAHRMTQEILNQVYADSKPREVELKRLSAEKTMLDAQVAELAAASKTAQKLLEDPSPRTNTGALAESIASISSSLVEIQTAIRKVDEAMHGLSDEDLVQAPTLPKKPSAPKKALIAAVSAVAIGFAVLVFVLLRQSWRASRSIELHHERVMALKRRYRLR
ncbi:Lipopolysaccharide biosynthesis protein [Hydrogenophaga intermedia]|uniref:Lipopolysaccharide biosynthesis protein n=2 Tax=Comamonadaceae TaxID=80864 RepID=A0A1L1PQS8_HYDIT|nr:Lipopolysaccharide biosynthesis protein [Hydrogenophaga intermedia]